MPAGVPVSSEIKELLVLIRQGHLFAVEKWLKEGKPFRVSPDTRAKSSPLLVAIETGFHSMVEVILAHLGEEEDLHCALILAIGNRRTDLVELLLRFGADPKAPSYDYLSGWGSPDVIRLFEEKGTDLVTGWPIAKALANGSRTALGTFMRCKDRIPELQVQLDAALRIQARKGSLRWVALLMWAGGNPRAVVPDIESKQPEEWMDRALEEGAFSGNVAVMKKLGVSSEDDVTALLCRASPNVEMAAYLLELGADPNALRGNDTAMNHFIRSWEWHLDPTWRACPIHPNVLKTLEFLGTKGGRWAPHDPYHTRCLRTALAKAPFADAINGLKALINAGVFTQEVFKELMATPRMGALLAEPYPGVQKLRDYAGYKKIQAEEKPMPSDTYRPGLKRRMGRV